MRLSSLSISSSILWSSVLSTRSTRAFSHISTKRTPFLVARTLLSMTSTTTTTTPVQPPIAHREEDRVVLAGVASGPDAPLRQSEVSTEALLDPPVPVPDPYGWMRDESRTNEQVLQHLRDENAYTEATTSHLGSLRERIYQDLVSSIRETDYTLPRPRGDYVYYSRTFEGKSYPVFCRAPRPSDDSVVEWDGSADTVILSGEEILIDINELARGHTYCAPGSVRTSESHKLLAYTVDFSGDETCSLFVRSLETGEIVKHDDRLQIYGRLSWGKDDETLFYLKLDDAKRPYQVYKRRLGTNIEDDVLLFEDLDDINYVSAGKSLDGKYLFIESSSSESSEWHYLDLEDPEATLQCVAKRRQKVLYEVEHRLGEWWITTNVGGTPNMRLMKSQAKPNCEDDWKDVIEHSGNKAFDGGYDQSLAGVTAFKTHLVAEGRQGGVPRVWVLTPSEEAVAKEMLTFEEEAHDVGLHGHSEFDTDRIAVAYDSYITPLSSLEVSLSSPTSQPRKVLKSKTVPGYDKSLYDCERLLVKSRDGETNIPVLMMYRKDVMEKHLESGQPVPTHLYGYGSYGSCEEADFRVSRLVLVNRGMVCVAAQVRGGGEMGRQWYEEPKGGKYLCKKNTFNDFVDVGRWLVDEKKLTSPQKLCCEGRSAGGLLIGATINQAPDLFKAALLGVPFVDVVCTMIDSTIPLTCGEWEEWGNPNEAKYHQYMMEYSPMNNVQKGAKYPACLLTGGLHDPRVQFWEPAKFAAELRHTQGPGSGPVCLRMDMTAGHMSASDRYKNLRERAFDFAFLLDQVGLSSDEQS